MRHYRILLAAAVCAACFMALVTEAAADIPLVVNHQGRVSVGETPFDGTGAFRFALVDTGSGMNLWTNDGSGIGTSQPPTVAISLPVTNGLYSIGLGNVGVPGMTSIASSVFDSADVVLRIWFDDGVNGSQYLTPDQALSSTAYAFHALVSEEADTLDGVHAADLEESTEITDAVAAHTADAVAHGNIELDAARIVSGALDLARVPQGTGSGLDADTLDGQNASAFMSAGTDNWVDEDGDTMTGRLIIDESIAQPLIEVTNGSATAIQGTSDYTYGNSIRGLSNGEQGRGVYGECTSETNTINYGGYFVAQGDQGRGVYGRADSDETMTKYGGLFIANGGNGIGCRGEAGGDNGKGVYGFGYNSGDVTNFGGYFNANGATGRGCYATGKAYAFYASSTGTDYGPFTGAHEARIAPDSIPLVPGLVVSATGATAVRTDDAGNPTLSSTMPEVTASTTPNDPAVLGVFVMEAPLDDEHWYAAKAEERFGIVNALGEGRVWVCDVNGPPQLGDYVTTSAVAGYAQRQDDDLVHNYTLGKVIEAVDWASVTETVTADGETYTVYLIAVIYTSG